MHHFRQTLPLALLAFGAACTGSVNAPGTGSSPKNPVLVDRPPDLSECRSSHWEVYETLSASCVGCHATGSFPAFSSFEAFEQLIAYNPDLVEPGAPEDSRLLELLGGTANANAGFTSMPPGEPYAKNPEELSGLTRWVTDLRVCAVDLGPPTGSTARRLTARQIQRTLYQQLELRKEDFSGTEMGFSSSNGIIATGSGAPSQPYRLYSPLEIPGPPASGGRFDHDRGSEAWSDFGGSNPVTGQPPSTEVSVGFMQRLIPLSQAWCLLAASDPENESLFQDIDRSASVTEQPEAAKANLHYLFLRLLSLEATEEEVEEMYTEVLVPLATEGTEVAWAGVCASLIRDPPLDFVLGGTCPFFHEDS